MLLALRFALIVLALCMASGAQAKMSDIDKKLCALTAAPQLPAIPGLAITRVDVDISEAMARRAVDALSAVGGPSKAWVDKLSYVYGLMDAQQTEDAERAISTFDRAKAQKILHDAIVGASEGGRKAAAVTIGFKAGVLEGAYTYACAIIDNRAVAIPVGLAE